MDVLEAEEHLAQHAPGMRVANVWPLQPFSEGGTAFLHHHAVLPTVNVRRQEANAIVMSP
jgi:hypothetical protein